MNKLILSLVFLLLSLSVNGQEKNSDSETFDYYCAYYGQLQMSGKVKPKKLIWGDNKDEVKLTDKDGKEIEFRNMVDVANYLSKRGWKFVESETFHDACFVIFVKKITSDENPKEGLYFNTDFKK